MGNKVQGVIKQRLMGTNYSCKNAGGERKKEVRQLVDVILGDKKRRFGLPPQFPA